MPSIEEVVRASLEHRDAESTDLAELPRVRLLADIKNLRPSTAKGNCSRPGTVPSSVDVAALQCCNAKTDLA